MKKIFAALAAALLAVLAATGCGGVTDSDKNGDPGVVSDKESDSTVKKTGKTRSTTWEYELTILRPDGTTYEKDVSSTAYDRCKRGSKYPACVGD